ncbi:hypothetical protein PHYBOEH_007813 [Phytophthora boehmeriae]|uniref:Uncharacterized protein n=1 Tax=Phytophthora boehmeriae TaxID=109152 RepID=A0A8T1X3F2_9STRA|nr:hypothetical protein PHYBOEH_007813 [Phytophthora boehmeriae]
MIIFKNPCRRGERIAHLGTLHIVDETTVDVMDVDVNFKTGENMCSKPASVALSALECTVDSLELLYISESSVILAHELRLLGNIASAVISFSHAVIDAMVIAMTNIPGVIAGLVEQMSWAEYGVKREATWAM